MPHLGYPPAPWVDGAAKRPAVEHDLIDGAAVLPHRSRHRPKEWMRRAVPFEAETRRTCATLGRSSLVVTGTGWANR